MPHPKVNGSPQPQPFPSGQSAPSDAKGFAGGYEVTNERINAKVKRQAQSAQATPIPSSTSKSFQFTSTKASDVKMSTFMQTLRSSETSQAHAAIQASLVTQDIAQTTQAGGVVITEAGAPLPTPKGIGVINNQITGGEGFGIGFGATAGALITYATGVGLIMLAYFKGRDLIGWVVDRVASTVVPDPVAKSKPITESQVELAQLNTTQEPYDTLEFNAPKEA